MESAEAQAQAKAEKQRIEDWQLKSKLDPETNPLTGKPRRPPCPPRQGRPKYISHSQIQDARCLWYYKLTRLTKEVSVVTPEMLRGQFAHRVLHRYVAWCQAEETDGDFEKLKEIIDEQFEKSGAQGSAYMELRQPLLDFGERGVEWRNILALECRETVETTDGVPCQIVIDRVNAYDGPDGSVLEIVDYKTQANIATPAQIAKDQQLRLYRCLATTHLWRNQDLVRTGIYHVRYNKMVWDGAPRPIGEFGHDDETIENLLSRQWERIHGTPIEEMKAERGLQCDQYAGCKVRAAGKCPAFSEDAIQELASSEDVEDWVRAARAKQKEVDVLSKKIKGARMDQPPMEVDGKFVGFKESESKGYRLLPFLEFANDRAVPLADIVLNQTQAEKALRAAKINADVLPVDLRDQLEEAVVRKSTTRFVWK